MSLYTHNSQIAQLKQAADIIVETVDGVIYLGFCSPNTNSTTDASWSILQIRESNPGALPNETTFLWAEGQCFYNLIFANYATYNYYFKKF